MNAAALVTALKGAHPPAVVDKVIEAYSEMKRNLYLGHLRPNEVEGGRFAEGVFRLLQHRTTGVFTPLGTQINSTAVINAIAGLPSAGGQPDSVRLHIPRTLRVIYDIRNNRDAAHLADGIDANLQDATLVASCCDWVMAELARLYLAATPKEAIALITDLVEKRAPIVQEFGAFLKTLKPALGISDRILVLLYHRSIAGATQAELASWLKPSQRASLPATLTRLEFEKDFIHRANGICFITQLGELEVERKHLLSP